MPRIRTIKPEFWTSEQVVECSIPARLLFIGLWNFCDDAGNHPASAKTLKMQVYPGEDFTADDILHLVGELLSQGLIVEYTGSDNLKYWHVTGWHHQKIERANNKYPVYDHSPTIRRDVADHSPTIRRDVADHSPTIRRDVADHSPTIRRDVADQTPEEGKGKERNVEEGKGKESSISNSERLIFERSDAEQLQVELENSDQWLDDICRKVSAETNILPGRADLKNVIPKFVLNISAQSKYPITLKEAKSYFSNWVCSNIKKDTYKSNRDLLNNRRRGGISDEMKERMKEELDESVNEAKKKVIDPWLKVREMLIPINFNLKSVNQNIGIDFESEERLILTNGVEINRNFECTKDGRLCNLRGEFLVEKTAN